ncbi:MAG: cytochrome P450 [Ardenticatenia bacterium]|nr:cytochrome P450 [Ardenticatenia bacterium]
MMTSSKTSSPPATGTARPLDDDELISLILGMNFAGHETTTGQAAWTIIQLLQNPWYLELVQAEIARHLPPGTPIDRRVIQAMPHLNWAIRETERMRPSAEMLMRYVTEATRFGTYVVPEGWLVPDGHRGRPLPARALCRPLHV